MSILKIDMTCILLLINSVVAIVSEVYDLKMFILLQQLLSFIRELVMTDIKDSSAEHDFNSFKSS